MKNTRSSGLSDLFNDFESRLQEEGAGNGDTIRRLRRNLYHARAKELTPRQEEVIRLYYDQRKPVAQIADELGVRRSTVYRTIKRAEDKLRRYLQYSF